MLYPPFQATRKEEVIVTRYSPSTLEKGRRVQGTSKTLVIEANVQPLSKKNDTLWLPEADRSRQAVKLYTTSFMQKRREGDAPLEPDTFVWKGDVYEVIQVFPYAMGVLNHYKVIALRKELT